MSSTSGNWQVLDGLRFDDRHVLVTGGSTGIGRDLARGFAAGGARVTVLDRFEQPGEETEATVEAIESAGGDAQFAAADLREEASVESAVEEAEDVFGPLDVLVNNAGVNHTGRADEIPVEEWDEVLAVDLRGAFLATRFALPSLRETGGNVVNVASTAGLHGSPNYAAYGPAKAALINFTRQVAVDFSPEGVRSNAVAPGVIDAGMAAQELSDPEVAAFKEEQTLLSRFGTTEDVTNAALFLASDAASFITGATLVVDGGWSA